jgi:hypothetical protein
MAENRFDVKKGQSHELGASFDGEGTNFVLFSTAVRNVGAAARQSRGSWTKLVVLLTRIMAGFNLEVIVPHERHPIRRPARQDPCRAGSFMLRMGTQDDGLCPRGTPGRPVEAFGAAAGGVSDPGKIEQSCQQIGPDLTGYGGWGA